MNLDSTPTFQDNYIWVLSNNDQHCPIMDLGKATPVLKAIAEHNWAPETTLPTHHHQSHVDGVKELPQRFPQIVVYGPAETQNKGAIHVIEDGGIALVLGHESRVIATLDHALGHICCFSHLYLFCGGTLFSGGRGRLFEGTATQMYQSLKKMNELPNDTLICCAHEYTLANMKFALSIFPHSSFINEYYREVNELRVKKQMALPVILKNERRNNLFLRTGDIDLINEISKETILQQPKERFAWLRSKKGMF